MTTTSINEKKSANGNNMATTQPTPAPAVLKAPNKFRKMETLSLRNLANQHRAAS